MDDEEISESGGPIYRYEARERPFEPAFGNSEAIETISGHIERHLGPIAGVYHEIISDVVHVDLHYRTPTPVRPYYTLITSGMSDRPMAAPPRAGDCRYAELMLSLPATWPFPTEPGQTAPFQDEAHDWPLRWLKTLARFPHEYDTWLWWGHTMPHGDPPEPFAPNTKMCGLLLADPVLVPETFLQLRVDAAKTIHFFSLLPLYQDEMEFKLKRGAEELLERFDKAGVTEELDIGRRNVCAHLRRPF